MKAETDAATVRYEAQMGLKAMHGWISRGFFETDTVVTEQDLVGLIAQLEETTKLAKAWQQAIARVEVLR